MPTNALRQLTPISRKLRIPGAQINRAQWISPLIRAVPARSPICYRQPDNPLPQF